MALASLADSPDLVKNFGRCFSTGGPLVHPKRMLSVKTLRENLQPQSPQSVIDHWLRVFEKFGDNPDFENPRIGITMRSGAQFGGYLISGITTAGSKDRHLIISLLLKHETDQARDIIYVSFNDIETVTFYDVDHILQYLPRKP